MLVLVVVVAGVWGEAMGRTKKFTPAVQAH